MFYVGVFIVLALDQFLQAYAQIDVGRISAFLAADDGFDVSDDFLRLVRAGHPAEPQVFQVPLINSNFRQVAEKAFQFGAHADELARLGGIKLGIEVLSV